MTFLIKDSYEMAVEEFVEATRFQGKLEPYVMPCVQN